MELKTYIFPVSEDSFREMTRQELKRCEELDRQRYGYTRDSQLVRVGELVDTEFFRTIRKLNIHEFDIRVCVRVFDRQEDCIELGDCYILERGEDYKPTLIKVDYLADANFSSGDYYPKIEAPHRKETCYRFNLMRVGGFDMLVVGMIIYS